jgi:hypothetical protein
VISSSDRNIIRVLARQVADIADLPIQPERRNPWKLHNSPKCTRPMILVFPEGSWQELLKADRLLCTGERTRTIEWQLRGRISYHEHFQDSTVIETG